MSNSPLFSLPYLATSQLQKETTHNEALNLLETLCAGAVQSRVLTAPPVSPAPVNGQAWLVAAGATGAWAGKAGYIAAYYDGWLFLPAVAGMSLWIVAESAKVLHTGSAWVCTFKDVSFSAYLDTTVADVTGDGTVYTPICETEIADTALAYDAATGVFTAPIDGLYEFTGSIHLSGLTSGHTTFHAGINTSGFLYLTAIGNPYLSSGDELLTSMSQVLKLTAGQTARLYVNVLNGTKVVDVVGESGGWLHTRFSGKLLL